MAVLPSLVNKDSVRAAAAASGVSDPRRAGLSGRVIKEIERLEEKGFYQWKYVPNQPIQEDPEKRIQVRVGNAVDESIVASYREALEQGKQFPPIITTADNAVADGVHRTEAHKRAKRKHIEALVILNVDFATASAVVIDRLRALAVGGNREHGKRGNDADARGSIIALLHSEPDLKISSVAKMLNASPAFVGNVQAEFRLQQRIEKIAEEFPTLKGLREPTKKGGLNQAAAKYLTSYPARGFSNQVWAELVRLISDAGMQLPDIRPIVTQLDEIQSGDPERVNFLLRRRLQAEEQIQALAINGVRLVSGPNLMRRALGLIRGKNKSLDQQVEIMIEQEAELAEDYCDQIRGAIDILERVLRRQHDLA